MSLEMKLRKLLKKIKLSKKRNIDNLREINYDSLKKILKSDSNIIIVDVRSPQEFAERKIKFAINIPLYELEQKCQSFLPDKDKLIILYCQCGVRSKIAYDKLKEKGYTNLCSLSGGLDSI